MAIRKKDISIRYDTEAQKRLWMRAAARDNRSLNQWAVMVLTAAAVRVAGGA